MPTQATATQDAHYLLVLTNLLEDGGTIAADLAREAISACDKAEPYERIARAIRRTVVLARHISANPIAVRDNPVEAAYAAVDRRIAAHRGREHRDETAAERDSESLRLDRLDDCAADLAVAHRDPDAVIGEIRRDLGAEAPRQAPAKAPAAFASPVYTDAEHIEDDDDQDPNLVATLVRRHTLRDG